MDNFWTLLGIPLLVLVVGLVVEYWIIQPLRYSHEFRDLPEKHRRDWITATSTAIKGFIKKQPGYDGILRKRNIQIEQKEVRHGTATIVIGISEKRYFWNNIRSDPQIVKRVELTIDRTGDILAIKPLKVDPYIISETKQEKRSLFTIKERTSNHPNPYAIYLYVIVGLLGASGGFSSAVFLYDSSMSIPSTNDALFWGSAVLAIIFGAAAALGADIYFKMYQAYAWQRLPIALILGALAGALGLIAVCIVIIGIIIWLIGAWYVNKY